MILARDLKLIPDCLEVGRHLRVCIGHAGKRGINPSAGRLHLRVQRILYGFILGMNIITSE
jgi:hypothetical protein